MIGRQTSSLAPTRSAKRRSRRSRAPAAASRERQAGAVRRRRQPLRHDAAADDARRASAADDPAGDPLHPRGDPLAPTTRTTRRRLIRSITKHPRWGDFGLDEDEFRARAKQVRAADAQRRDPLLLRALRREAGQAALGRQDAALHAGDAADRPGPPRGPLHPPDPRRPRRRPLAARADRSTAGP